MIDDKELVFQLKNKATKDKAFKNLMHQYKERLYWHIRGIAITHEDTDDILQNTFIKIYRNIENFKGQSKLYTWLYRIATNEAITFVSKKAKNQTHPIEDHQHKVSNSRLEDHLINGDDIETILNKAINSLPEKQQLVFKMKYFENMKYSEISEILETSIGALKASYFHAVKKIEKIIETH